MSKTLFEKAEQFVERREAVLKKSQKCPYCGEQQIQITDWFKPLYVEYKCRICRNEWHLIDGWMLAD